MASNENDLIECPYNSSHQILRKRFQTHLIKCQKAYKDVKKVACPFNSTHLINQPELNWHVENCKDRATFERFKYNIVDVGAQTRSVEVPSNEFHEEIEPSEDWSDYNVPSYNPEKYCNSASVIRLKIGAPPSERKAFRNAERARLRGEE